MIGNRSAKGGKHSDPEGSLNCGESLGNKTDFAKFGKKKDCEITQRTIFYPNLVTILMLEFISKIIGILSF